MNVALFGGSFDPPHIGHIEIVNRVKQLAFIDKVVVMPTFLNPFKESFSAPPELRLMWLKKLFTNDKRVEVSDFEIQKSQKVPTYTTVLELKKRYSKIYLVIGSDNLESLSRWHMHEKLLQEVELIVITRKPHHIDGDYTTIEIDIPVSSTQLRTNMDKSLLPQAVAEEIYLYYKEHNATKS